MGHIGEELGFVLGSERQFCSLFFYRIPRLFNLLIFPLDFSVLFGELLGLSGQLFVRLL